MSEELSKNIKRAKELLVTVKFAVMATVNEDLSPHNTPFLFLHDKKLTKIFWGSHPGSLHSQNVTRTGQIFIVVYDAFQGGGLYIECDEAHSLEDEELNEALTVHNSVRIQNGKEELVREYYSGNSSQRMWSARVKRLWVNAEELDEEGHIIKDYREEIQREDLIDR